MPPLTASTSKTVSLATHDNQTGLGHHVTTTKTPELQSTEDIWMDEWPRKTAENGTSVIAPFQTAFHIGDYSQIGHSETSGHNEIKQNQMLPIYCSIMGLVILFLLFYVVYKLWKQREAMTNAKLSEVYTTTVPIGYSNSMKLALSSSSQHSPSPNGMYVGSDKNPMGRGNTKISGSMEREPLLETQKHETDSNYLDAPLQASSPDVLGMLCVQLSQKGWRDLACNLAIPTAALLSSEPNEYPIPTELYEAAKDSRRLLTRDTTVNLPSMENDDSLKASIRLIAALCRQTPITVKQLLMELERIHRGDLVEFVSKTMAKESFT